MKKSYLFAAIVVAMGVFATCFYFYRNLDNEETLPATSELELDLVTDFDVPDGPVIQEVSYDEAPVYLYLFTHTEDPFNHELSEERYWRIGEMLTELAAKYPDEPFSWSLQFIGADAKTVTDRNDETGLVDYLLSLKKDGLVEFGYHAHHDPTYMNRPQNDLDSDPSWDEVYTALKEWVTCVKELDGGGCVEDSGGGLQAILNTFGEVKVVSGVGTSQGVLVERSAGAFAIREDLAGRIVGFGLADHGSFSRDKTYDVAKEELMTILTPNNDTNSTVIWMDNSIRLNDGVPLEGLTNLNSEDGISEAKLTLSSLDRESPVVLNIGVASKYIYTAEGTSPTIYGYSHADSPELPEEYLNSPREIEANYAGSLEVMEYILGTFLPSNDSSRFVSNDDVVDLFTSDDYWTVTLEEAYQISLWTLNEWNLAPPNYTYDGEDYYSLTDSFWIMMNVLQGDSDVVLQEDIYGPWGAEISSSTKSEIDNSSLRNWVATAEFAHQSIPEIIEIDSTALSPAQVLYAMSMAYVMQYNGVYMESIAVPKTDAVPETYYTLEDLGCTDCLDTAWSLKPARFQD